MSLLGFIAFDPLYFLILAPGLILAIWAQVRVKSAYAQTRAIPSRSGLTGAQAAERMLAANGVRGVSIEPVDGMLSDHYDPRHKVLRLSPDVYGGRSLAALGIAAHEAGHALQDRAGYAPLALRNGIVPLAMVGGNLSMILFMVGTVFAASRGSTIGPWLMLVGVGLYTLVVLFQLINLPVEFDASRRANAQLVAGGIITADEAPAVRRVLSAAALTYVAATVTAILTLAYLMLRANQNSR